MTYTDADVDVVDNELSARLVLEPDDLYREMACAILRALVAAGWAPRAEVAEGIADALDAELKHGAPAMSPAYHSGYRDAARYVRNRGAEAGRG
jgi:hypothetical protein